MDDLADNEEDWDDIYRQIAEDLFSQQTVKINADLHLKTAKKLINAVNKGLEFSGLTDDENRKKLAEKLKQNIYPFSAAKSFTQMQYYRNMMIGENGTIIGKDSFIKKIADTGEIFNKKYLEAEYENAYYSAIMADKWDRFGEDDILEYSTAGDSQVRPSHKALDKFAAPKSDPVWRRIFTPNGWGCRCNVVPGKSNSVGKVMTSVEADRMMKVELKGTPFDNNVGLSKVIFKNDHPYFINANGKELNLSWEQYGLSNLEKIRTAELPEYQPKTKEEYFNWWKKQTKTNDDDIVLEDVLGNKITFESSDKGKDFKNHIIRKSEDKRFEYATELETILKTPDEVWMNPKDKNTVSYLKFYENGTIRVVVNKEMKGETMYLIEKDNNSEKNKIGESRKGILLYR